MDAVWQCLEPHKPLMGLGLAPQLHRPSQELALLRAAVHLDHLLDAGAPFVSRVDWPHTTSVVRRELLGCPELHTTEPSVVDILGGLNRLIRSSARVALLVTQELA